MLKTEHISVSRLKAELAHYVGQVKAGRKLVVTDRGKPVAVIEPVVWDFQEDETMKALILKGLISPATEELGDEFFCTPPRVEDPESQLRTFLEEERRCGW